MESIKKTISKDNLFFVSDTHFGHKNIIEYYNRPFLNSDEQTSKLIENWNKTCDENSTVFFLGDFALRIGKNDIDKILCSLNFKDLYFIPGNHEKSFKNWYYNKLNKAILRVHLLNTYEEINIENQFIVLCHYPLQSWRGSKYGSWHLHGHEHGGLEQSRPESSCDRKILDVGVDCHKYSPVSYQEIKKTMNSRKTP
jgi:calcineurin-like phosphoesterase family protein